MQKRIATAAAIVVAGIWTNAAQAAVWTGAVDTKWEVAGNWDWTTGPADTNANGIPDAAGEDAVVNDGTDRTIALTPTNTPSVTAVGNVRIAAGDRLNYAKASTASPTLTFASIENAGTFATAFSWANNQTASLTVSNLAPNGGVFNSGTMTINGASNRTNSRTTLTAPAGITNTGTLTLRAAPSGGGTAGSSRLVLSGTGDQTLTNTGTISLAAGGIRDSNGDTNSYSEINFTCQLLLDGTAQTPGSLQMTGRMGTTVSTTARITGGTGATFTQGANHSITGDGLIGNGSFTSITNKGLIKATHSLAPIVINPGASGAISNEGRLVAEGAAGIAIGSTAAARTFTNTGIIESRTGSAVVIESLTTATLNGEIRGGGRITAASLPVSGIVAPGDSANSDGTGASTIGPLTVNGNVVFNAGSELEIQIGASNNDVLAITGTGNLDLTALPTLTILGELTAPSYTIATYSGTFAAGGGFTATGLGEYQLSYGNGLVTLSIPEPATVSLLGAVVGFGLLGRRRKG